MPFAEDLDGPDDLGDLGEKSRLLEAASIDGNNRYWPNLAHLFAFPDKVRQLAHILIRKDREKV